MLDSGQWTFANNNKTSCGCITSHFDNRMSTRPNFKIHNLPVLHYNPNSVAAGEKGFEKANCFSVRLHSDWMHSNTFEAANMLFVSFPNIGRIQQNLDRCDTDPWIFNRINRIYSPLNLRFHSFSEVCTVAGFLSYKICKSNQILG